MKTMVNRDQVKARDLLSRMVPFDVCLEQIEPDKLKAVRRVFGSEAKAYQLLKTSIEEVAKR